MFGAARPQGSDPGITYNLYACVIPSRFFLSNMSVISDLIYIVLIVASRCVRPLPIAVIWCSSCYADLHRPRWCRLDRLRGLNVFKVPHTYESHNMCIPLFLHRNSLLLLLGSDWSWNSSRPGMDERDVVLGPVASGCRTGTTSVFHHPRTWWT